VFFSTARRKCTTARRPLIGSRPLADSIYWTSFDGVESKIQSAALSGGGTISTLYDSGQGANVPAGLAIDPAAEQIYWCNRGDHKIQRAPLAGGTVDTLYDSAHGVSYPMGLAIDTTAGRIYWSNADYGPAGPDSTIRSAPLAGGGAVIRLYGPEHGVSGPTGVAIDPNAPGAPLARLDLGDRARYVVGAARQWLGDLFSRSETTGPPGRIYWSNTGQTIQGAPLGGGGPVDTLYDSAHGVGYPTGLAIDATGGRIYWSELDGTVSGGEIRGASLTGHGGTDTLYGGAEGVRRPVGVAVDPTAVPDAGPARLDLGETDAFTVGRWLRDLFSPPPSPTGRIYWSNGPARSGWAGTTPDPEGDSIRGAPLTAGGAVDTLYDAGDGVTIPLYVAVLRTPVGAGPPRISWSLMLPDLGGGGGHAGPLDPQLSCSRGTWAADLPGSFLYRAPHSFAYQWRLNGADIGGATASTHVLTGPGSYSCRVTASNAAGSDTQMSAAMTIT
jgi:hypothetical protein